MKCYDQELAVHLAFKQVEFRTITACVKWLAVALYCCLLYLLRHARISRIYLIRINRGLPETLVINVFEFKLIMKIHVLRICLGKGLQCVRNGHCQRIWIDFLFAVHAFKISYDC